ncbi:hypothetical protein KJZ71_05470 [Patescibacteria group bacterium]|uniref:Haloacid dehalogenase n=1 Tax=candidate division WWE3 bacterium TaxID=2053526 RepID=A0A928Y581_UNCKA|nr:hypothetical protein [candidate division WWE3 bacterium]MCL4733217.1 hypothetical protein [Patescibacteria group bacterium]
MLNKTFYHAIAKRHRERSAARRELQQISADLLAASKRAIFATQRNAKAESEKELAQGLRYIKKGNGILKKEPELGQEGMWRAGLEEFAEASLYHYAVFHGRIGEVRGIPHDPEIYVGALSDVTGELSRSAVLAATKRDAELVQRYGDMIRDAVAFLLTMNLTGASRQKFDQAKQNLRKIEEIAFTLSVNGSREA